jgi:hypothetical protein
MLSILYDSLHYGPQRKEDSRDQQHPTDAASTNHQCPVVLKAHELKNQLKSRAVLNKAEACLAGACTVGGNGQGGKDGGTQWVRVFSSPATPRRGAARRARGPMESFWLRLGMRAGSDASCWTVDCDGGLAADERGVCDL